MQEKTRGGAGMAAEEKKRTRGDGLFWRVRILRGIGEAVWAGGAWLLGQAPMAFNTYPLGLALLCASKKHTLSILIGLVASAFWQMRDPAVYICTYIAAALVRMISAIILDSPDDRELFVGLRRKLRGGDGEENGTEDEADGRLQRQQQWQAGEIQRRGRLRQLLSHLFSERIRLRMLSSFVCAFIIALYRIIGGGFRYYDLFAAIFALVLTPAAVVVYAAFFDRQSPYPILRRISQAALLFSLVYAADGITVFAGFPLADMLSLALSLWVAYREGVGFGSAVAILSGLAYDPMQIPSYLLAVLCFSLFKGLRKEGTGVWTSCLCGISWSVYARGIGALLILTPTYLLAGTVVGILIRIGGQENEWEGTADKSDDRLRIESCRGRDSSERFRGISDAFSSLSEMFYNLSDRFRRPGTLDLRQICDASFDSFCPDCPNKSICWGLEYSQTMETMSGLISALHTKGRVGKEQIPQALSNRCESAGEILKRINSECAKLTGELLRNNRTEIFAMDYESTADIINDALEEDDGEYRFYPELEEKISEYLADAGVRAHSVTVYGNRRRQIIVRGVDVEQATVSVETMRADLGEMCALELACPVFELDGNVSVMTFRAKKKISAVSAQNNVSADGGISGDSVNLFSNKKDYFYALINDGMGAGKEAALTSNICSVFLEKMLRAGNRASTSLRMLNNLIRSRGTNSTWETSSTVDLLELDLISSEASFIKSGAAPSFVIRGKVVHRLQSGTAPIGIIRALDVQTTPYKLKAGDTVVMISDGILQDDPDCEWISAYLADCAKLTPEEIVYHICLHAAECEGHDDCSAIAVRILDAEE